MQRFIAGILPTLALLLVAAGPSFGQSPANHLGEPPDRNTPIDDPIPGHIERGAIQVQLETLTEGNGLTAPNWGTFAPGQPNVLYVVDQDGPLWAINVTTGTKSVFLNTRPLLVPLGAFGPRTFDERGFLGVAFHPDYRTNGLIYTYTSEPAAGRADFSTMPAGVAPDHHNVIREWRVPNPTANPIPRPNNDDRAVGSSGVLPSASRVVLRVAWPQFNHNGGAIFFGTTPEDRALLYITMGDGGCADDQDGQTGLQGETCVGHGRTGNGQNPSNPLGDILRINPLRTSTAAYSIPPGNPFASSSPPGALPEIFAFGFRNPFRASSDRFDLGGTGAVWTADVGQNHIEEVDARVRAGGNYGWRVKEGRWRFNPDGFELFGLASDGFVWAFSPGQPPGLIDPNAEYDHDEGVAVLGGFVYRGQRFPELRGRYVFGDYSRRFTNGNGEVFFLDERDVADPHDRTPKVFHLTNGPINAFVLGFGEDRRGELYVLANDTGIPFSETGLVMKVVRQCADGTECRD